YNNLIYSQVCTINSYLGWLKWCNCNNLIIKYYNNANLDKALNNYNKEKNEKKKQIKWNKICNQYNEVLELLNNKDFNRKDSDM
ncbi:hypothetical protein, partial [Clostridium sp. HV4-5-A1G]|uniref:hypothetical protein n=1 Tax=Clostridium sp. HV4-5-A1G TaxID=2004595 RepID=UPI001A9EC61E